MSLEYRRFRFQNLVKRFDPDLITLVDQLIARVKIPDDLFHNLKTAAAIYVSSSLPDGRFTVDEKELLGAFVKSRQLIKNCTPNGMMVPKKEISLQFNLVVRAFADIIESFNFGDLLVSWHVPLNIRYKDGHIVKSNLERAYPTEDIHSDSWAGESADSVTTMIPLFGDTEQNRVDYYTPPDDFQEEWLGPQPSYRHNQNIAQKYTKIEVPYSKGYLYFVDFGTLHSSARYPSAGPRISIDTTFAFSPQPGQEEKIHPWRVGERASHSELRDIGRRTFFSFNNSWDDQVDNKGGFKHPTDLKIVSLSQE